MENVNRVIRQIIEEDAGLGGRANWPYNPNLYIRAERDVGGSIGLGDMKYRPKLIGHRCQLLQTYIQHTAF